MKNSIITIILAIFIPAGVIYSATWFINNNGDLNLISKSLQFGSTPQKIYGDTSSALYYDSNNSNYSQLIFRDKERKIYGRVYGNSDGQNFGLLDADGQWSYLASKDNYTELRVNDSVKLRANANGDIQANRYCNFKGECIDPSSFSSSSSQPQGSFCGYIQTLARDQYYCNPVTNIKCNNQEMKLSCGYIRNYVSSIGCTRYRYTQIRITVSCPKGYVPYEDVAKTGYQCVKSSGLQVKTFTSEIKKRYISQINSAACR